MGMMGMPRWSKAKCVAHVSFAPEATTATSSERFKFNEVSQRIDWLTAAANSASVHSP
jgi:hypothetical protein